MRDAAGDTVVAGDGRRLTIDRLIKSGAAGAVYRLRGVPNEVAKLYHPQTDRALYQRKVEAMLQLSPNLPELNAGAQRYVQIAWPTTLLRDPSGQFLGYLMPAVDVQATSELEQILQERQARAAGLPTGLGAKITLAANLAAVVAELHKQQHHVVDLKPVNLRFYSQSLYMAMLDCDGFSIQGSGERFAAPQFTVDYLAPEFQAAGINVVGEEQQDRFALAVIVFQLLNFGIHPFTGRPTAERVPTDIPGRIEGRYFAYGLKPSPLLQPNPGSGHAAMPTELRALFDRAFTSVGQTRPPPMEWAALLRGYAQRDRQRLVICRSDSTHQHFAGLPCAACARGALIANAQRQSAPPPPPRQAWWPANVPVPVAAPRPTHKLGSRPLMKQPALPSRTRSVYPTPAAPLPFNRIILPNRPPAPSKHWLLRLVVGYHNLFGPRGWGFLFVALFVFTRTFVDNLQAEPSRPTIYATAPPPAPAPAEVAVPEPVATPPAASGPSAPPPGLAYTGVPDQRWATEQQWRLAQEQVGHVTGALADGNPALAELGLRRLRRMARDHAQASAGDYQDNSQQFRRFTAAALTADASQAIVLRHGLEQFLRAHPADAERICEWAWLALHDGQRELAEQAFHRAIWADPDYSGGWAGLGAVAEDQTTQLGALVMAAKLRSHDDELERVFDDYTLRALNEAGLSAARWRLLKARGQALAAESRGSPEGRPGPSIRGQAR